MRKLTFFLTLTLLIAACNGISTRQKGEGLATAMDEYIASLRWGRLVVVYIALGTVYKHMGTSINCLFPRLWRQ